MLTRIVAGLHNKAIALELGIGASMVETCRAEAMAGFQAETLSELVRIIMETEPSAGTLH